MAGGYSTVYNATEILQLFTLILCYIAIYVFIYQPLHRHVQMDTH